MVAVLSECGVFVGTKKWPGPSGSCSQPRGSLPSSARKQAPTFDVQGLHSHLDPGPQRVESRLPNERPEAQAFCNFTFTFKTILIRNV